MITFQNVTKHYDNGSVVVDGLSLVAPGGKITVFVGPSGCGKTTSLRMINRLVEPSSGRILLNGEATEQMDIVQLRRRIGYVIQNAGLFPHKNIIDNIATTAILNGAAKSKARARAGGITGSRRSGSANRQTLPWQLSGGQQQRVGVARALAADPEFMLMDEPFSAVDPVVREQLQEEFLRIQKEVSKTIIMVTHDIDEAMKLGDLVAVLKPGGKLAQMASPGELLNTPQNAFVADFIGKDRGYRKLSFHAADTETGLRNEALCRAGLFLRAGQRDGHRPLAAGYPKRQSVWLVRHPSAGNSNYPRQHQSGGDVPPAGEPVAPFAGRCAELAQPPGRDRR
ncbi:ATP-binding cassette domain-containing protein [Klebsiella variicola subsp. variicola]|nr:ATP-binding cassette domain-containing protein [Klebsiella variicola subsp. variicola]